MYKLWCLLIYGYIPQWEIYKEGSLYEGQRTIGRWYDMRCTKTGNIKRKMTFSQ